MWVGHRINPNRHMQRWYQIWVQPDLWDQWAVWVAWGRMGQRAGQPRIHSVAENAEKVHWHARRWRQRKQAKGYITVWETKSL